MLRESFSCNEAQSALAEIKSLKGEFERAYAEAIRTGDLRESKELRSRIEQKMIFLREAVFPLERELNLKTQYESQKATLESAGILERLTSGEMGITCIDGKEYPMPSYQEIMQWMRGKKEILTQKKEQGFVKLLVVPFGMSLDSLTQEYGNLLLKHHTEGKLFATKENQADPNEALVPLELNANEPVWRWSDYANADVNGKLVYEPKEFSESHGGKTKAEILQSRKNGLAPAWRVLMIGANPNIPRASHGKEMGGRKQFEANRTPNDYLQDIGKGTYDHETGMTPEDWLAYAITNLQEWDQVIDDYQGNGSIAYNTGAYFPTGNVPLACWDRGDQRARLFRRVPAPQVTSFGARSAVRV
jgi:hypothetical protein